MRRGCINRQKDKQTVKFKATASLGAVTGSYKKLSSSKDCTEDNLIHIMCRIVHKLPLDCLVLTSPLFIDQTKEGNNNKMWTQVLCIKKSPSLNSSPLHCPSILQRMIVVNVPPHLIFPIVTTNNPYSI